MLHNNGAKVVVSHETTKSLHHFLMEIAALPTKTKLFPLLCRKSPTLSQQTNQENTQIFVFSPKYPYLCISIFIILV